LEAIGGIKGLMNGDVVNEPVVMGDRGRRTYAERRGADAEFRPARRVLGPARTGADVPRPEGLRRLPEPTGKAPWDELPQGRRANPAGARRSGYDVPEPDLHMDRKNMVPDKNGALARETVSMERTLETFMTVKRKVPDAAGLRNGIPVANPGDKAYTHVDYSRDYHKGGGLVPGSTFALYRKKSEDYRSNEQLQSKNGMGAAAVNYMKPQMTFQEKRLMKQLMDELNDVRSLTNASTGYDEDIPSWEDRTGMHTYKTKNKNQAGDELDDPANS